MGGKPKHKPKEKEKSVSDNFSENKSNLQEYKPQESKRNHEEQSKMVNMEGVSRDSPPMYEKSKGYVKVLYLGGAGIRKEAKYPGDLTGHVISFEKVVAYSKVSLTEFKGRPIKFYGLANGKGWIHDYDPSSRSSSALEEVEHPVGISALDYEGNTVQEGRPIHCLEKKKQQKLISEEKVEKTENLKQKDMGREARTRHLEKEKPQKKKIQQKENLQKKRKVNAVS